MVKFYIEEDIDNRLEPFFNVDSIFSMATLENCDFILYPNLIWDENRKLINDKLGAISSKYESVNRFVIVFIISDYEEKYKFYPNLLLVRSSLKASLKQENELILPYIWDTFSSPYEIIENHDSPHIGFCGFGSRYRKKILTVFAQSNQVVPNFIIRDKFWGGNPHDKFLIDEFNNNIKENPYIISQRGRGNFSMRFYQTLSAGRIPVLVNTDMVLPFKNKIDWENAIIFEKDEKACLSKVIKTFERGDYIEMQRKCYEIHTTYFSQLTFIANLIEAIKEKSFPAKQHSSFINKLYKGVFGNF